MTQPPAEYINTRKQWLAILHCLISAREDETQDELFKDAQLLFQHMQRQKWEQE